MKVKTMMIGIWLFLLASCDSGVDKKDLLGQWQGTEWLIEGQSGDFNADLAMFTFKDDGRYAFRYNDNEEQGDYFISGAELFTTPDGGTKMMVKIDKLTTDSLVFLMNRGGTSEKLTLIRK